MPNTKGMTKGSNRTANQFSGKNRKMSEPGQRLGDQSGQDHKGVELCKNCGAVHFHARWYRNDLAPAETMARDVERHEILCPACKQIKDQNPGGILTMTGGFLKSHLEEIMNLLRHEDEKAQGVNPLEKIMEISQTNDNCLEITTTNEFLVQRLGRAVHSAYSGDIEFKFGGDDLPVRVCWHRD